MANKVVHVNNTNSNEDANIMAKTSASSTMEMGIEKTILCNFRLCAFHFLNKVVYFWLN
jgi:hypothetical protein